jgi:predicted nucleic acid-binding protein
LIAGIASAHGLAVATRDVTPFIASGVSVINPWDEA